MDLCDIGGHRFTTHCLIKYTGRKSAKTIITPLIYGDIGGEVVICASKGGADHHPAWYLNIRESKELCFQIATQAFRATWREPAGAEREKVWEFIQGFSALHGLPGINRGKVATRDDVGDRAG